jgi:hypothetical protein
MTTSQETPNNVREQKERERRRKKYKFALVKWLDWGEDEYCIEYKSILNYDWYKNHEVICDDQPERVLRGMLKLLKEDK